MANIPANPQISRHSLIGSLWMVALICLLHLSAHAQEGVNKKALKLYEESSELMNWNKFDEAEKLLLEAIEIEPEFKKAIERLGYIYIQQDKFEDAFHWIEKLVKLDPGYSKEAYYYLGLTGLASHRFEAAKGYLEHYRKVGSINAKREEELKLLEQNITFASVAIQSPIPFEPVNAGAGVNTSDNEYFPAIIADGKYLYFTRQKQFGIHTQEDIMVSYWNGQGWEASVGVSSNINTETANEGAHSISPDGNTLYFTLCEGTGGFGGCDIYVSRKQGNDWSRPMNLGPNINTKDKETQPCISPDGQQLYFVSSRPGGYGKLDIWVSHLQPTGDWGKPENLGPLVNTVGIDERPYIHTDNATLYFSSDAHPGFGDGDIYLSRRQQDDTWGPAINLGYPLNSYSYEGGIYVTREGHTAYFATDRFSKGGDLDIYHFELPPNLQPIAATYIKGKVTDKATGKAVQAQIAFIDLTSGKMENQVTASADGSYLLTLPAGSNYALNISMPGYLFHSEHFTLESIKANEPFTLNVQLQPVEVGKTLVLKNIFYDKEAFSLKPESKAELDKLVDFLKLNPKVKIEVSGHTDDSGTAAFNNELSQKRAASVTEYLTQNGIDPTRLTAKGYGQNKPIAPNDSETNRALNRRTELKILAK